MSFQIYKQVHWLKVIFDVFTVLYTVFSVL